ncbi:hypothetical protein QYF61_027912 [Mycteria americana]|uniref:Uncharacterized protein n=1 Tax=Mycteria americana TaxID=33587 RepID=A0AAN7S2E3_MYCAM|nr:hypothetical protein QYF61_027912 [Mycteria americana]
MQSSSQFPIHLTVHPSNPYPVQFSGKNVVGDCITGIPLKGLWPKDKSMLEKVHLEASVAVDKSMLQQVHLEASVAVHEVMLEHLKAFGHG